MDRRIRLLVALGVALVLMTVMIYTALAGGAVREPVVEVAELPAREAVARREVVELVGVAAGPVVEEHGKRGEGLRFFVTDRRGGNRLRVDYRGSVPDAFRVGRHVIVKGKLSGEGERRVFRAKPNSLVTKCPSKFETAGEAS